MGQGCARCFGLMVQVNSGLLKMYTAEVLHKLPIVQHVLFGPTMRFDSAGTVPVLLPDRLLQGTPVAGPVAPNTALGAVAGTGGPARGSLRRSGGGVPGPASPSASVVATEPAVVVLAKHEPSASPIVDAACDSPTTPMPPTDTASTLQATI